MDEEPKAKELIGNKPKETTLRKRPAMIRHSLASACLRPVWCSKVVPAHPNASGRSRRLTRDTSTQQLWASQVPWDILRPVSLLRKYFEHGGRSALHHYLLRAFHQCTESGRTTHRCMDAKVRIRFYFVSHFIAASFAQSPSLTAEFDDHFLVPHLCANHPCFESSQVFA